MKQDNSEDFAIKLSGVKKKYRMGQYTGKTLKEDFLIWCARRRGAQEPAGKIGARYLPRQVFMALNGIDLEIRQGEAVGIIGPNGAGKSTLLKLLCQITAPTEGQIELFGRVTSILEVGTGFNGELTGRENIYQNGAILGMTKNEIDRIIEEIIDFSEMREFIDTPVKRYSSGMYVKLGFAIASHLQSEIVIMDEVLAVGDLDFQRKCLRRMRTLAEENHRTILYVSHNMYTIRQLCRRVIVLNEGKIIFDGDTETGIEIYQNLNSPKEQFSYDFSGISTNRKKTEETECKLMRLNLVKKDSFAYESGEPLLFQIGVLARRCFRDMAARFIVSTPDAVIGAVPCCNLGEFSVGEQKAFTFSLDTSCLVEGKYILSIALTESGKISENYDFIAEACFFTIRAAEKNPWKTSGWGRIKLTASIVP